MSEKKKTYEAQKRWAKKNAQKIREYSKRKREEKKAKDLEGYKKKTSEYLKRSREKPENKQRRKKYDEENKEIIVEQNKERCKKYRERMKEVRKLIIDTYGGKCECCGEKRPIFLAIDHINGDGGEQRKKIRGDAFLMWIIKNKFPNTLRILCHNCNTAFSLSGSCPHQFELFNGEV